MKQRCTISVCKYTHVGFITELFGCKRKEVCSHLGYYCLQQYKTMKSLQYKCATTSPKDMQQGKERKRKDQSAKICMPCNETGLTEDLIHEVLGNSQKSGGGTSLGKTHRAQHLLGLCSLRFRWECPHTSLEARASHWMM